MLNSSDVKQRSWYSVQSEGYIYRIPKSLEVGDVCFVTRPYMIALQCVIKEVLILSPSTKNYFWSNLFASEGIYDHSVLLRSKECTAYVLMDVVGANYKVCHRDFRKSTFV